MEAYPLDDGFCSPFAGFATVASVRDWEINGGTIVDDEKSRGAVISTAWK